MRAVAGLGALVDLQRIAVDHARACREIPRPVRPAREGSAGRARPRRPSRRHRAARGSGRRGRGRLHRRRRRRATPGMAAIRASNWRSRMKFWPSALVACRPWRAMTSRSGSGTSLTQAEGGAVRGALGRPWRMAAAMARGSARSCAGDVERRAMVGRGADDRQAQRDVDAFLEMQRLQRDQRLVVIHAERRVILGARRGVEHGVGRVRAGDRASLRPASASIAGMMMSISSRPSAPPSPAWGLSPATASRGSAIPKLRCSPRSAARPRASISAGRQRRPRPRPAACGS